ncbi:unnamed protein product [Linum trigynum]|uniref:Uncharacterized protein n=1 Tax=Linum trigynum TaxID=586398 RepID=A0AAV2F4W4_9ROSI
MELKIGILEVIGLVAMRAKRAAQKCSLFIKDKPPFLERQLVQHEDDDLKKVFIDVHHSQQHDKPRQVQEWASKKEDV